MTPGYLSRDLRVSDRKPQSISTTSSTDSVPIRQGLLYKYKNEPQSTDTVAGEPLQVAAKIRDEIESDDKPLHTVLLGVDELWDVSVMKFIYEFTNESAKSNFSELSERNLLDDEGGVPRDARLRIEDLLSSRESSRDRSLRRARRTRAVGTLRGVSGEILQAVSARRLTVVAPQRQRSPSRR